MSRLRSWDGTDPEGLASEYVSSLMRHGGWRPTNARSALPWHRRRGVEPPETYRTARARLRDPRTTDREDTP